jgi:hypothetical protein
MSELLRYRWTSFGPMLDEDGPFVLYADHVAALAQADVECGERSVEHYRDGYQRAVVEERNKWKDLSRDNWQSGYEQGQRDALAAAVQRVEALPWSAENWFAVSERAAVIAAIKGDNGGRSPLLCHWCQQPVAEGLHGHVNGTPLCKEVEK